MPVNFKSVGKKTALRDILKIDRKLPITPFKERSPFLIAPFREAGPKPARQIQVRFNMYEWLNDALARHDPFMSSFYESWKASVFPGNVNVVNTNTNNTDLQNHLSQFASYANGQVNTVSFVPARLCAAPIGLRECTFSTAHTENIVCSFFCVGPGTGRTGYRYSGTRSAHNLVLNVDCLSEGTLFYMVVQDDSFGTTRWFTIKPTVILYDQPEADRIFADTSPESYVNFVPQQSLFIETSLPRNYDAPYNNQTLLPFVDAAGSFFTTRNTTFSRRTSYRWRISGAVSMGANSTRDCNTQTEWSGTCYEAPFPKKDLFEYELTRDPTFVGKGKIYVADDDVCCCPHTGYPLRCTLDDQYTT
jgi:hypothetical protein